VSAPPLRPVHRLPVVPDAVPRLDAPLKLDARHPGAALKLGAAPKLDAQHPGAALKLGAALPVAGAEPRCTRRSESRADAGWPRDAELCHNAHHFGGIHPST
jgi:hypothetical protein